MFFVIAVDEHINSAQTLVKSTLKCNKKATTQVGNKHKNATQKSTFLLSLAVSRSIYTQKKYRSHF